MSLKDTLNLPKTNFPMQAQLVKRENERLQEWEKQRLYQHIQEKNAKGDLFMLHDGPPFTNGDVHIGTALNKILKDIIIRYKSMQGYSAPYVPGWDCHGLPIEHKVLKEHSGLVSSTLALREACEKFSEKFIQKQELQFKRLGILGDWEHAYRTKNPAYEAEVLRVFAQFVRKNLVYRSKKPVYWSIPCKTALAEAEIEYKPHTSQSIWVKFSLITPNKLNLKNTHVVIWTTTPWTLPANRAIAVSPVLNYVILKTEEEKFLVAQGLAEKFLEDCGIKNAHLGHTILGSELEGLVAQHPFIDRQSPIVLADYVNLESGTGCVHTAPGHGAEDYLTGLKYKLEIDCPVDDNGALVAKNGIPSELAGLSVGTNNGRCPANEGVIRLLQANNKLLHTKEYIHSYPHCWRSKTPIIFRAVDQWFIRLETLKNDALKAIEKVQWVPGWGQNRIKGFIESRPDWCISRQRTWGIPLPAFYDEEGNFLLNADFIEHLAHKIEKHGSQFWFEKSEADLLEGFNLPSPWDKKILRKSSDTLDVWIDSGCSHWAVLKSRGQWPADVYLEGSDQHRGWFQSSLWTALVMAGSAPYKAVLTHGFFINEESRKKISKSEGTPQTSEHYVQTFGADILRLWVASENYRDDIPVSETILKHVINTYRTIRNTLRFQLGNLYDFKAEKHAIPVKDLMDLDKWALFETYNLVREVTTAYEAYEFHKIYQLVNRFCALTLSARYHDILKDRLYTYAPDSFERRSAQTVIATILDVLTKLLAPILIFTADEAYAYRQTDSDFVKDSIHLNSFPKPSEAWNFSGIGQEINEIFKVRESVQSVLENARQERLIGQSLDAKVELTVAKDSSEARLLGKYHSYLPEYFIVSQVVLKFVSEGNLKVQVCHADGVRCPRTWRWVDELVEVEGFGKISKRCAKFLSKS